MSTNEDGNNTGMRGYDLIHDVVTGMSEAAPLTRAETLVKVLTSDGDVLDIVRVTYDEQTNTVWLRAAVAE